MNPRLQFITNPVPARIRNNDSTSSSQSDESDTDQANSNEQCNRCLQRNKLLTEVIKKYFFYFLINGNLNSNSFYLYIYLGMHSM